MSKRPPSGNVDVRLGSGTQTSPEPLDPDTPFRLLVLGDFGGSRLRPARDSKDSRRGPGRPRGRARRPRRDDGRAPRRRAGREDLSARFRRPPSRPPARARRGAREVARRARAARESPVVRRGGERGARLRGPSSRAARSSAPKRAGGEEDIVSELLAGASRRQKPAGFGVRGRAQGDRPAASRPRGGRRSSAPQGRRGRGALRAAPRDPPQSAIPEGRGGVALARPARAPCRRREPFASSSSTSSREALLEDLTSHESLSGTGSTGDS